MSADREGIREVLDAAANHLNCSPYNRNTVAAMEQIDKARALLDTESEPVAWVDQLEPIRLVLNEFFEMLKHERGSEWIRRGDLFSEGKKALQALYTHPVGRAEPVASDGRAGRCAGCGCGTERHHIEQPYPCMDCECTAHELFHPHVSPRRRQPMTSERDAELRLLEVYLHPGKFVVTRDVGSCSDCGEFVGSGMYKWCGPCLYQRLLARLRAETPSPEQGEVERSDELADDEAELLGLVAAGFVEEAAQKAKAMASRALP